jgi:H3 lysine-79-specific histone-lysine N-methyltransferase
MLIRFNLAVPKSLASGDLNPIDEIIHVADLVSKHYLTDEQAEHFKNPERGILRKLERAKRLQSYPEFRDALDSFNETLVALRRRGAVSDNIDNMHSLPLELVEFILAQACARTVSLRVHLLKRYENGSDNVYGELLPPFVSKIFKITNMRSDQVFVDLGSGVGNVVLQAALEIGCESWGCEIQDIPCQLAEEQGQEFRARCRLWGLAPGETHLETGDFLENQNIAKVLRRADIILVNNQVFGAALNDRLVHLFLDLKDGCQIVSLRSFVPYEHKFSSRTENSLTNILEVDRKEYFSGSVSWTDAGGQYFIATKDSKRPERIRNSRN